MDNGYGFLSDYSYSIFLYNNHDDITKIGVKYILSLIFKKTLMFLMLLKAIFFLIHKRKKKWRYEATNKKKHISGYFCRVQVKSYDHNFFSGQMIIHASKSRQKNCTIFTVAELIKSHI